MTDLNNEGCELTVEDLEAVSGGRIKIEKPAAVLAWEIAKLEADNPGFAEQDQRRLACEAAFPGGLEIRSRKRTWLPELWC